MAQLPPLHYQQLRPGPHHDPSAGDAAGIGPFSPISLLSSLENEVGGGGIAQGGWAVTLRF